jgi:hypothetical protein
MIKVSVRVDGLKQILDGIANMTRQDLVQTKLRVLYDSAKVFEDEANAKVHVITGKTQNSIRVLGAANDGSSVDIEAAWGAPFEEDRKGEHAFMSMAAEKTDNEMRAIIIKQFDAMWNKNRGATPLGSRFF